MKPTLKPANRTNTKKPQKPRQYEQPTAHREPLKGKERETGANGDPAQNRKVGESLQHRGDGAKARRVLCRDDPLEVWGAGGEGRRG